MKSGLLKWIHISPLQRWEINKLIHVLLGFIVSTHLYLAQIALYWENHLPFYQVFIVFRKSFSSGPSCILILTKKSKTKAKNPKPPPPQKNPTKKRKPACKSGGGIKTPKKNKKRQKEALKNYCKYSLRRKNTETGVNSNLVICPSLLSFYSRIVRNSDVSFPFSVCF